ncbi:MAG TPA: hypothetical protein DIT25_03580 [Candidatus Moranbacteria bacterium]|nr:hypothetical protein [Candidatus Moranbacteria bacterium]
MKRNNLIALIAVVVIGLGAAFFFLGGKQENGGSGSDKQGSASDGIKQGLLGLLENTSGIKCSVEDETGKYTVVARGQKAKIEGIAFANPLSGGEEEKGAMINDGTWAYMWGGKEGIKLNIAEMEKFSEQYGDQDNEVSDASDWRDWAKEMETSGAKYDCSPTVATDSDFTPPSEVVFQDFGQLFQGLQQMQSDFGGFDPSQFNFSE